MSKTACWGTNRLDVDIAEVYCGYNSCHDMCFTKHGFQVSLEALKAIVAFDFDYMHTIAMDMYPYKSLTNHGYKRLYDLGITDAMLFRAKDIMDKHYNLFWQCVDRNEPNPEIRELCLDILKPVSYYAQYSLSPLSISFKHLNKQEEQKKATEWFQELIPYIHMHGYIDPWLNKFDNTKLLIYLGYPSHYKYADIANKAIAMYDLANDREHSSFIINDKSYTDMYLCLDTEAINERERLAEEKSIENKKRIKDFIDCFAEQCENINTIEKEEEHDR